MAKYIVRYTNEFSHEIEAESEEAAIAIALASDDTDKWEYYTTEYEAEPSWDVEDEPKERNSALDYQIP